MSLQVTIVVRGSKETQAKLNKLGSGLLDLHRSMAQIGDDLTKYYSHQAFESQGGVFGNSWPPLAASTVKARLRRSVSGGSGILSRSYTPLISGDPSGMHNSFASKAGSQEVLIYNKKPYFKYHQSTSSRKRTKSGRVRLPRRQMMGVNSRVQSIVGDIIREDVRKKIASM